MFILIHDTHRDEATVSSGLCWGYILARQKGLCSRTLSYHPLLSGIPRATSRLKFATSSSEHSSDILLLLSYLLNLFQAPVMQA